MKRTVGRPRAKGKSTAGPAKAAILQAAAELFVAQGYAGTSTRAIADRVGIRQPSLFYHFAKKEDILRAIVDEGAASLFEQLAKLEKRSASAAVTLYALLRIDIEYLLTEPYGIGQLMLLPELRSGDLKPKVQRKRNRIIRAYQNLIEKGVEEGDLECGDLAIATHTVFGMGEATWSWYKPSRAKPPGRVAETIADMAMKTLLRRPASLAATRKAAIRLVQESS